jgi:hypothetical protein
MPVGSAAIGGPIVCIVVSCPMHVWSAVMSHVKLTSEQMSSYQHRSHIAHIDLKRNLSYKGTHVIILTKKSHPTRQPET